MARVPRLGLAGMTECWFQEGQAAWPTGELVPNPGPGPQCSCSSPALPSPPLCWRCPLPCSLSLCCGMEVWGLAKFSEAKWEVQGRQRKEGKPTDHRRKPRELSWPLGPGHPVQPLICLRHTALCSTQEHTGLCCSLYVECSYPSIHPTSLCLSITSLVKPSMTPTGGHTSAVLLEPKPSGYHSQHLPLFYCDC